MSTILIGNPGPDAFEPGSDWVPEAVQIEDTVLDARVRVQHWTKQVYGTGPTATWELSRRADEFRLTPQEAREVAASLIDAAERVERFEAKYRQATEVA